MTKKIYALLLFIAFHFATAQTYVKANVVTLPVGMVNFALEAKVNDHITLQPEFFVSPWKSFLGKRFQVYYFSTEGRYYFKESFKGFYAGGNFGIAFFDLKKWNYLESTKYQRGYTILMGATIGYQYPINDRWNADFFLGGGTSQGFYHGYNETDGQRYETSAPWNRSGEWIPYKGGVMISYKLK
jgi:hypothetical protein